MRKPKQITKAEPPYEPSKAVLDRISRSVGHLGSIKRMLEENRDYSEVLIQLSAVESEINVLRKVIVQDYIDQRFSEAIKNNDTESIDKLKGVIKSFL